MRRAIRILAIIVALVAIQIVSQADGFRKEPYLIYPGRNTEMDVLWQTDATANYSAVEWGATASYGNSSGALSPIEDNLYQYRITSLSPGAKVYYRVTVDGNNQTGSFKAAPPEKASRVSFYAWGDTRSIPADMALITSQINANIAANPDRRQTMAVHSGDWASGGWNETEWDGQYFDDRAASVQFRSEMAVMGCKGNHDFGTLMEKYIRQPYVEGLCCAYTYGPVRVVIIDQYTTYTPGSAQYDWIENELSSHQDKHLVVCYHQPAWGARDHYNNSTAQSVLQPLFEQHNVKLVINGHSHHYARCLVNGVNHVTSGGGGAPRYGVNTAAEYCVRAESTLNFLRVDIYGNSGTVIAYREDGSIIEKFRFTGPGAPRWRLWIDRLLRRRGS